jgi:RNA polymerase sigma-70 factor, ECF subfamily
MSASESFFQLLSGLRAENPVAAEEIFERFGGRLIGLARTRLNRALRRKLDPEDVLQSVLGSFFRRQRDGEFDLESWDGLWALLVLMTVRKCCRQSEHFHAARRDARREVAATSTPSGEVLDLAGREPTPYEAALLADVVEDLLNGLGPRDRQVVALRLQGFSVAEISGEIQRTQRTVRRVLEWAKSRLQSRWDEADDLAVEPASRLPHVNRS